MNFVRPRLLTVLLLTATLPLSVLACDGDSGGDAGETEASSQSEWSPMPESSRAAARSILTKFDDSGLQQINALRVLDIIIGEGIRNFAGAYANASIVIENEALGLTIDSVLPLNDANGFYDPTGGWVQYPEVYHDSDGDETSDSKVNKQVQRFNAGSITGFDYADTTDSPTTRFVYEHIGAGFTVDSAVDYTELAYHQQKAWTQFEGITYGETYAYQGHDLWNVTLDSGNSYAVDNEQVDDIDKSGGWTVDTSATTSAKLSGTLTMYRPGLTANVQPNNRPELDDGNSTVVQNGQEIVTTEVTTLNDTSIPWGDSNELEQVTITRTSVITETRTDEDNGKMLFEKTETHTTKDVRYYVVAGGTANAIKNRAFEKVANHIITTRNIDQKNWSYQGTDGDYTLQIDNWTYKYTDNPATRNDLLTWKSTHTSETQSFDADDNDLTVTHHGTEWLLGEIEADSDINGVGFTWDGNSTFTNVTESTYFGASNNGLDTTQTTDVSHNFTAAWNGSELGVNGSLTARGAAIDNGDGLAHSHMGDGDGSFQVTYGGETYKVSAEEWLNAIIP